MKHHASVYLHAFMQLADMSYVHYNNKVLQLIAYIYAE